MILILLSRYRSEDLRQWQSSSWRANTGSGVLQTAHCSVIHPLHMQTVWSLTESEESRDSFDSIGSSRKARGILAWCPSYRKFLKYQFSEDTWSRKGDGENPGVHAVTSMSVPTPIYQTSNGQYTAISPNGALQLASPGSATRWLYKLHQEICKHIIPIAPSATSLSQTVLMTSLVTLTSQTNKTDDPQLKREMKLMKNSEAAQECHRKTKEYVKCLENRVVILENQNKTLIEELKTLKDLYSHKSV
ncbi:Cyclic AMP-dependent transcription factor ATF-1 [Heterocephalus glaber]|uniref:Cyclic AMP-dependent transcription factor ATF-1 n=1 Tax=Heterocephalus glaber TaxID=10181 RepID=G5BFN5_HETGA|nr:Cyclic AMP-dependent transcription factor ATF-1 [Heterocephalus glaber]